MQCQVFIFVYAYPLSISTNNQPIDRQDRISRCSYTGLQINRGKVAGRMGEGQTV
jgi:hypothetical protein